MKLTADKIIAPWEAGKILLIANRRMQRALEKKRFFEQVTDYFLISVTYYTGLRVSEVCALNWQDVAKDYLVVRSGKGGKKRTVYFGNHTAKLFVDYKALREEQSRFRDTSSSNPVFIGRKGRLTPSGVHRRFKKIISEAGLSEYLSFHSLRHGYATRMMTKGTPLAIVRDQLGHANISTTSAYLHFTEQHKDVVKRYT